jgi:N-acetylglucosamine kinase-like BadF-type ATPase
VRGELPAVLAIDGGNSKTDLILVSADGDVLATVRGPGSPAPNAGTLGPLVAEIARQIGHSGSGPLARHTSACLANADLPEEERHLEAEMRQRGWSVSTQVRNDTFAVLRAGTQRPWGVAVVCGAGINCVGVAPDGRTARFLAMGHFTGDWGGGMWLGNEIMYWAMRAEDGRGTDTALRTGVAAHFGERTVHDVAVSIHLGRIGDDDLVALTPVLFEAAEAGDLVAVDLIDRQAEEIFLMARTAMARLDLTSTDTDVVLGGGILAARHRLLTSGVEARLKREAPAALPRYVQVPPVVGAALLGLDRLGFGTAAQTRLRDSYLDRDTV